MTKRAVGHQAPGLDRIVLGTANLGQAYGRGRRRGAMTVAEARALLDAAWDLGVRVFDTATAYGEALPRLSDWLRDQGVLAEAHIVAKLKPAVSSVLADGARSVLRAFQGCASLTLLTHDKAALPLWDAFVSVARSAGAAAGQSVYTAEDVRAILSLPGLTRIQIPVNLYCQEALEVAARGTVPLDARSVFLQGVLLDPPEVAEARVPGAGALTLAVMESARAVGEPAAALVLAAAFQAIRPGDRVVVGVDRPAELDAIRRALSVPPAIARRFVEDARRGVTLPLDTSVADPRCWPVRHYPGRERSRAKVVAVVQARTSSSRLLGKVLAPVGKHTLIERVVQQVRGAESLDLVVVATSSDASDDELVALLKRRGIPCYRGDLDDVLGRFGVVAEQTQADILVRLTGDCPLHTPDTIDAVVNAFLAADVDYATNTEPYTRPDGQDVEVFTREALGQALRDTTPGPDREHVTPYLRRAPGIRRLAFRHRDGRSGANMRWTVDMAADLDYVRRIWERLDALGPGPHKYETVMSMATEVGAQPHAEIPNRGYYRSLYAAAEGRKAAPLVLRESEALLRRSEKVIPGGAQTYSKSWRHHIRGVSPVFLQHGQGARVWDVDGNEYIDLIQGLLANILGYAHLDVDRAVAEQCSRGHSFSLPHPIEVQLAQRLTGIIPCAEMVRFAKNGSDATAAAVRLARAFTRRDHIAVCGYHGWQDWYIGTTSRSAGVPDAVRALAHSFPYNNLDALDKLLAGHRDEFAAVIMEPYTFYEPDPGYLSGVKEIAQRHGALLIFDEICTGFHLGLGGAQKHFGVIPDLATFGKAMGNGYPISAVAGRREVMRVFDDVFVSLTFAGEVGAMAAALVVLDILEHTSALERMEAAGIRLRDGVNAFAEEAGCGGRVRTHGHPRWQLIRFVDTKGQEDEVLRALWLQEVTRRGVLILSTHNTCAALDEAAVEQVLRVYAEAFKYVGSVLKRGDDLRGHLDGPVPTPAFRVRA